jgi:Domain of unknown function (DUF4390)
MASIMLVYPSRTGCDRRMYFPRNNRLWPTASATVRGAAAAAALLTVVLCLSSPRDAGAQEFVSPPPPPPAIRVEPPSEAEDRGRFEIREADVQNMSGVYFLDATIDYRLSSEARDALQSGVPLTIRLEVELLNNRRLWWDNEDAALRQLYQLEYHALSERYTVQNVNSGDQASFSTLHAALSFLGRVNHLPILDAALLDPERSYDLRVRAVLDVEQFPGPLRLLAFWRRDWSLGSDWYRWRLQGD